jgi:hypothetical protein
MQPNCASSEAISVIEKQTSRSKPVSISASVNRYWLWC